MAEVALTMPEAINRAAAAYEQGRLDEAEQICRAILGVKADAGEAAAARMQDQAGSRMLSRG